MVMVTADKTQELRLALLQNLRESLSVYDIVAACYSTLLDAFGKDDNIDFIVDISAMADNESDYDATLKYQIFRDNVVIFTNMIEISRHTVGIGIDGFSRCLIDELEKFECPNNIDELKHLAFCAFYIIEAIDTYVEKYVVSKRTVLCNFGPLNKKICCEKCAVYFKERESILEGVYDEKKAENPFRKQLHDIWLGSIFQDLLIVAVEQFDAGTPKIVPVGITPECREDILKSKMLRIADIPFIGFDTFDFYETDTHRVCEHGKIPDGKFSVKYYDDDTKNIECILNLLELAIKDRANIIILPEFIVSEKMLDAIKKRLAQIDIEDKLHLMMVFAGTSCELKLGDKEGHNILHILSPGGYEMGRYYKYSPFNTQNNERPHGGTLNKSARTEKTSAPNMPYLKNCELLSVPGKECCIFDVEVVGRVLPAICRDVIDGKYTDNLIRLFLPTLLLVPSWSHSLSGFVNRFSVYAKTIHVSSLLCNCCNAIKRSEKTIGNFVYPIKKNNNMQSVTRNILRPQKCHKGCPQDRGCARRIDIDFSGGKLYARQKVLFPPKKTYN